MKGVVDKTSSTCDVIVNGNESLMVNMEFTSCRRRRVANEQTEIMRCDDILDGTEGLSGRVHKKMSLCWIIIQVCGLVSFIWTMRGCDIVRRICAKPLPRSQ